MSSSYRSGGGHNTTHGTTVDNEALQRVRYMSHMERRARPPTFRPLTIVVVVLSIGLFIIGLIMIVIAHWPGVSGGDSLKIAGGVLMAVGGLVFIIAMVVTCVLRNREQERFEKSIASIAASRSNVSVVSRPVMQTTPTPSLDAKPGKSILKKTPSTSTYGTNRGSVFGEESDSGVANHYNNSFGQNHSYERDSSHSDSSAGKYEVYRIETLPDPGLAKRGRNGALPQAPMTGSGLSGSGLAGSGLGLSGSGVMEQSSTDSEAQVLPTAIRNTKKRRGQSPSVASGRQNASYTPDMDTSRGRQNTSYTPDMDTSRGRQNTSYSRDADTSRDSSQPPAPQSVPAQKPRREMQSYSNDGYDMYDENQPTVPTPQRKSKRRDRDNTPGSEARDQRKQRRAQKQADSMQAAPHAGAGAIGTGAGAGMGIPGYSHEGSFQNEAFMPQEADLGYSPPTVQHQTVTTTTTRNVTKSTRHEPRGDASHHRLNTSQLSSSMDDELRINIQAQPGTEVHITPTRTRKYRPPRTVASPSQSSVETEI